MNTYTKGQQYILEADGAIVIGVFVRLYSVAKYDHPLPVFSPCFWVEGTPDPKKDSTLVVGGPRAAIRPRDDNDYPGIAQLGICAQ